MSDVITEKELHALTPLMMKTLHFTQQLNKNRTHFGAGNEIRTRDTKLGKLVLYQLSYAR